VCIVSTSSLNLVRFQKIRKGGTTSSYVSTDKSCFRSSVNSTSVSGDGSGDRAVKDGGLTSAVVSPKIYALLCSR